ncbi:hypothetical protein BGX26_007574 [Mortierella sp. AD094]|nr:hypothetical protein BGX26_007574 [Mortierella sp. AD094]
MDQSLKPLRIAQTNQVCRVYGNTEISFARRDELGLRLFRLDTLRTVLALKTKSDELSSWSVLGYAYLKTFLGSYFFARHQDELEGPLSTRIQNELNVTALGSFVAWPSSQCVQRYEASKLLEQRAAEIFRRVIGAAILCGGADYAAWVAGPLGMVLDPAVTTLRGIRVVYQLHRLVDPTRLLLVLGSQEQLVDLDMKFRINKVQEVIGKSSETSGTFVKQLLSIDVLGCLYATLDLDSVLVIRGESIRAYANNGASGVAEMRESGEANWSRLGLHKVLGDAMEALVGAIFVDAGFDLRPVEDVLGRTVFQFVDCSDITCSAGTKRKETDSTLESKK